MKFFNLDGTPVDMQEFEGHSLVVMRVTKPMTDDEFKEFCRTNTNIGRLFGDYRMKLLICPDWIEFKEWK